MSAHKGTTKDGSLCFVEKLIHRLFQTEKMKITISMKDIRFNSFNFVRTDKIMLIIANMVSTTSGVVANIRLNSLIRLIVGPKIWMFVRPKIWISSRRSYL